MFSKETKHAQDLLEFRQISVNSLDYIFEGEDDKPFGCLVYSGEGDIADTVEGLRTMDEVFGVEEYDPEDFESD